MPPEAPNGVFGVWALDTLPRSRRVKIEIEFG
jgi:hypothetical protein